MLNIPKSSHSSTISFISSVYCGIPAFFIFTASLSFCISRPTVPYKIPPASKIIASTAIRTSGNLLFFWISYFFPAVHEPHQSDFPVFLPGFHSLDKISLHLPVSFHTFRKTFRLFLFQFIFYQVQRSKSYNFHVPPSSM